ncbi:MAG: hypothetical protein OEY14_07445, partial [Myxococcales bacterium]|nr:hypothetical protein [Myxococcales bacterium]
MGDRSSDRFEIRLDGFVETLSNHLYEAPETFLRELLRNAAQAVRARQRLEPGFEGMIEVRVGRSDQGRAQLVFEDDGVGMDASQARAEL